MAVSEDAIAMQFTRDFGDTLRFDHDAGCWFEWTGSHWRQEQTQRAFHYARVIGRRLSGGNRQLCKMSVAAGAERFARADPRHAVRSDAWDPDPWLLGTPDGVIDLKSGKVRPAAPADMITKLTACGLRDGRPDRWLRFLDEATDSDSDLISFLQRVAGYCLTGATTEHALFFLYGPGGNGKSVFLNLLAHVLGDYAVCAPMETFAKSKFTSHPAELAMLAGARMVTSSETEEGRSWAESRIKSLTGGDKITARFMRRDFFTFEVQFKLFFAGNHQPVLQSVDSAIRRRINMVPFTRRPPQPDPKLEESLKLEAEQILAWALAGCLEWQAKGLSPPVAVADATNEYFDEQDTFGQWLAERCELKPSAWECPSPLFQSWSEYARSLGEDSGSIKSFAARLRRAGLRPGKKGGTRAYNGIELRRGQEP